jgi:hypothetical protein
MVPADTLVIDRTPSTPALGVQLDTLSADDWQRQYGGVARRTMAA